MPGTNPCEVTEEVDICNERDAAPFYECLPVGCLSNNDCTDPSAPYCNAGNECVACLEHAHCDDSNACNGVETCSSQQTCTPGTDPCLDTTAIDVCVSVSTAPGYECQEVECLENDHCLDEDLCNGAESCNSDNECISGTPVTCDDGGTPATDWKLVWPVPALVLQEKRRAAKMKRVCLKAATMTTSARLPDFWMWWRVATNRAPLP